MVVVFVWCTEGQVGTSFSRISIADDHTLVAEPPKEMLETESDVVGLVGDGPARGRDTPGLNPQVAFGDIAMPDLNGLDTDSPVDFCLDVSEYKPGEEAFTSAGRRLIEAQEKDRGWIARELRDGIVQPMAMLTRELDQWRQHVPESAVELRDDIRHVCQRLTDIAGAASGFCRELGEQRKILKHRLEREDVGPCEEIALEHVHSTVVGNSAAIRGVLRQAEQVAATDSTTLILGETGTGKELIARTIHELSRRSPHPMIETNCAALPATLIESELFGREKGAYTGALSREVGRFELAHNSTIFLDEIGELPLELQPKLLRVLQEGKFERLGSSRTMHVNVRVIAATSRDLNAMVREGKFREDLFYRLNVFPILIPPLRERLEDLPALVWHILADLSKRMGKQIESVRSSTLQKFREYSWPGNVRELRNVIERYLILNKGPEFRADIPTTESSPSIPSQRLDEMERQHVRDVLEKLHWRVRGHGGAAEILGLKPTTLEARMKKLGIVRSV